MNKRLESANKSRHGYCWTISIFSLVLAFATILFLHITQYRNLYYAPLTTLHLSGQHNENDTLVTLPTNIDHGKDLSGFVTIHFHGGRLGSQIYAYCTLYGIARRNRLNAYLLRSNLVYTQLRNWFNLSIIPIRSTPPAGPITSLKERGAARQTDEFSNLQPKNHYKLIGYHSVYAYFKPYVNQLTAHFRQNLLPTFKDECSKTFLGALNSKIGDKSKTCVLVGIHTRRGDFLNRPQVRYGHMPADPAYLKTAIQYFRNRSSSTSKCIQFLVLGNDYNWNVANLPNNDSSLIFLKPSSAVVDMCVLSQCNHTIMTTGTYGWWAAMLTGGHTTYMKEYARQNSEHRKDFVPADYFPDEWVPL